MRIDVVSIFPSFFDVLEVSLLGKARGSGLLDVRVHDLRDWTHDRHRTVGVVGEQRWGLVGHPQARQQLRDRVGGGVLLDRDRRPQRAEGVGDAGRGEHERGPGDLQDPGLLGGCELVVDAGRDCAELGDREVADEVLDARR